MTIKRKFSPANFENLLFPLHVLPRSARRFPSVFPFLLYLQNASITQEERWPLPSFLKFPLATESGLGFYLFEDFFVKNIELKEIFWLIW